MLETKNKAGAELETVLAGGKKLGAKVVGLNTQGNDRCQGPISAAAKLNGKSALP